MNLSKEGYIEGGKRREEMMLLYYNLKIIKEIYF